jgi:hypothetical protein
VYSSGFGPRSFARQGEAADQLDVGQGFFELLDQLLFGRHCCCRLGSAAGRLLASGRIGECGDQRGCEQ